MTLESDIKDALEGAALGTLGTDIFYGPMRDSSQVPDAVITILVTGGAAATPFFGGPSAGGLRRPRAQVQVRSDQQDYRTGYTTAQAVYTALHKQDPAGYAGWLCDEPFFVEVDQQGRARWSLNLSVVDDTTA